MVICLEDRFIGPVGDFSDAAASGDTCIAPSRLERDVVFFVLRCRRASSLWCSLTRTCRLAGAISSAVEDAFDPDLVLREGVSSSPSLVGGRSLSISESDVKAVDEDAEEGDRFSFLEDDCVMFMACRGSLSFSLISVACDALIDSFDAFLFPRLNGRDILYIGDSAEKRPSSS